jgi:hypothetical protein
MVSFEVSSSIVPADQKKKLAVALPFSPPIE